MRGTRAKRIRRYAASLGADDAETQYICRQVKKGRRYIDFFDDYTYRQMFVDRVTGERHEFTIPPRLRAVMLRG